MWFSLTFFGMYNLTLGMERPGPFVGSLVGEIRRKTRMKATQHGESQAETEICWKAGMMDLWIKITLIREDLLPILYYITIWLCDYMQSVYRTLCFWFLIVFCRVTSIAAHTFASTPLNVEGNFWNFESFQSALQHRCSVADLSFLLSTAEVQTCHLASTILVQVHTCGQIQLKFLLRASFVSWWQLRYLEKAIETREETCWA